MTLSLVQTAYYIDQDGPHWVFALSGGEAVFTQRGGHFPTVTGGSTVWGNNHGSTVVVKPLGYPYETHTLVSGFHVVTPPSFSNGAFDLGTVERAFITVPYIGMGDDINAAFAMALPFNPAPPAWAWKQPPTHIVYGNGGQRVPPSLYSATSDSGLRAESLAWPFYRNAAYGTQTDAVMDREYASQYSMYGRVLIRNTDNGIYAGIGSENDLSYRPGSYRHWPIPPHDVVGVKAVFHGSPVPTLTTVVIQYAPYYLGYGFGNEVTLTRTVSSVVYTYVGKETYADEEGTEWGFDYYSAYGVVDVDSLLPDDCVSIYNIFVEVYTGWDNLAITAPSNCGFPAGACHDSLTGVWLPGRILKVGQIP